MGLRGWPAHSVSSTATGVQVPGGYAEYGCSAKPWRERKGLGPDI